MHHGSADFTSLVEIKNQRSYCNKAIESHHKSLPLHCYTMGSIVPPPNAITERVIIPVKGGVDDWKEAYKQFLLTLKEQPGFIRSRWGPRSENMAVLDLLVGMNSFLLLNFGHNDINNFNYMFLTPS